MADWKKFIKEEFNIVQITKMAIAIYCFYKIFSLLEKIYFKL